MVVQEQQIFGWRLKAALGHREDLGPRLDLFHAAREQARLEPLMQRISLAQMIRKRLGHVRQEMQPVPSGFQVADQHHRRRDGYQLARHRTHHGRHLAQRPARARGNPAHDLIGTDQALVEQPPVAAVVLKELRRGLGTLLQRVDPMRPQSRQQAGGMPAEQHAAEIEDDLHAASRRFSRPAVEPSRPEVSPLSRRGSNWLHSALPSSTPHWSKLLMPQSAPVTNTRCS
mmetsp:Transcript_20611/g.38476  ORF Transcript_20611/g.38476 Transcript_20611/m.38476 type:complete len:229 (+) Transcript_20611:1434-2120(+)